MEKILPKEPEPDLGLPKLTDVMRPPVELRPVNDQVVIALDMKLKPQGGIVVAGKDKPEAYPSGRVVATGRGPFCAGVGYLGTQLEIGDHVALEMRHGQFRTLPLAMEDQIYVAISETHVIGKLGTGADSREVSPWFKKYEQKGDDQGRILAP